MENSGKGAPSNGSVYVSNLPPGTDEIMLAEYFGIIGLLKKDKRTGQPKIWLYQDKATNEPKGDATVTYEDPHAALAAVEWFNGKDFPGGTIGVAIAESKSSNAVGDSSVTGDLGGLEENARDMNGAAGRSRGRSDGKAWQQEGDWLCPNTRCGNINWAKRTKCNICNTNKPGHNEGGVRGGLDGGYKELDEEEIEETRRRQKETDDGEMYDEFGNLKKKFRAKTQQAEAGKAGSERAGWEVEELGVIDRDGREKSRDRGREWDDRESNRNRERDHRERCRSRSRERDWGKDQDRDYNYDRDRDCGRVRDCDRDRSRYRY